MSVASSAAQSAIGTGPYFVHIEGLPSNYTWQNLKDSIRKIACHGIWTDMAVYPNGEPSGKGYARVQRWDEADNLFNSLTKGGTLNVHLWDISNNLKEARFVKCNCPKFPVHQISPSTMRDLRQRIPQLVRNPDPWQSVTPRQIPINSQVPGYAQESQLQHPQAPLPGPLQPSHSVLVQQIHELALQQPQLHHAFPAQYAPASISRSAQTSYPGDRPQPVYAESSDGIPKNVSDGYAITERRGIRVGELSYEAKERDIKRQFQEIGPIVKFQMPKKGMAIIHYNTEADARKAIAKFNGRNWMNRTLQVRPAKEGETVEPPSARSSSRQRVDDRSGPIIVNGSTAQGSQAQGRL